MVTRFAWRWLVSGSLLMMVLGLVSTPLAAQVLINELDADTPASDALEFVELYDGGTGNTSLTGLVLVFFNGALANDGSYLALDLDGWATDASGYFLAGNPGVSGVDLDFPNDTLQNGADAVALYVGNASSFPNGTPVTTANLVDALVYDTSDSDDAGLLVLLNPGQPQVNENAHSTSDIESNQRCPNGSGGVRNTTTYSQSAPSPGLANACGTPPVTVPIHDVQGSGATSPLAGQNVAVSGIVTGVKSNGFFLQERDENADSDPATSEGVFVFTSTAPTNVFPGTEVDVTGTVSEFSPSADPLQPPITEIVSPSVTFIGGGNFLPAAIVLDDEPTPAGAFDQLERYESMRVSVPSLTVVAPTGGTTNEPSATAATDGVFFGVVPGTPRPFRQAGVQVPDPLPPGAECPAANVPRFDANPERLRVDSDAIGHEAIEVSTGAVVSGLIGPLDYAFRAYTVVPNEGAQVDVVPGMSAAAAAQPDNDELTIASFNVERFFDDVNDPGITEPVLTATAYANRLKKASLIVRDYLHTPDVIGLAEMENLAAVQDLAEKIDADALAAGQPKPLYSAHLVEGNDVGGIDVGFLVKRALVAPGVQRVVVDAVTQLGAGTIFVEPTLPNTSLLNDRPPLVLEARVHDRGGASFSFVVIVNHLRSLNGISDPGPGSGGWASAGDRVRNKRKQQAEFLASLVETRQAADPSEPILLIGDFNAFELNDGFVDVMGTIAGSPAPASSVCVASPDLVTSGLAVLVESAPLERYSYSFDGSAQSLDHLVVNPAFFFASTRVRPDHARVDADFPQSDRGNYATGVPRRLSDHDPLLISFRIPGFTLFADGFESSNTSRWTLAVP